MKQRLYLLLVPLITTGWFLSTAPIAQAQLTGTKPEEFQHIEQPLPLKVLITTLGLGLMGFELWWFLLSRAQTTSYAEDQSNATASDTMF